MKKIYLTLLSGLFMSQLANAQTLTQAANSPVAADANNYKGYDSVGVVPKNMGANQSWNFGAYTQNATVVSSSFAAPASTATAAYPGVTVVENLGGGNFNYWKAATTPTTQLELLGKSETNGAYSYTNSAINYIWPVAFGNTNSDTYGGPLTGVIAGTSNGSITVNASGTGTITLPTGIVLTNILQTKITQTVSTTITSPLSGSEIIHMTTYNYYHASQKFPVLKVAYSASTISILGPTVQVTAQVLGNNAVITGLNDMNFDATFQIFPNPAQDAFKVRLSNNNSEHGTIIIYNAVGQVVKTVELGSASVLENNISITELPAGIYVVKTTLGNKSSARRLIVE
jgi:hypothetical protein